VAMYPSGTVACDVPGGVRVETDHKLLDLVVRSLVENGLEHGSGLGLWLVNWGNDRPRGRGHLRDARVRRHHRDGARPRTARRRRLTHAVLGARTGRHWNCFRAREE